jgi:hypothetical protein
VAKRSVGVAGERPVTGELVVEGGMVGVVGEAGCGDLVGPPMTRTVVSSAFAVAARWVPTPIRTIVPAGASTCSPSISNAASPETTR